MKKKRELRLSQEPIKNSVRAMRKARGMTQAELAIKVGLTRQAMYSIEVNQYLPSTAISLRLARILGCKVEDLFCLPPDGEKIEAELLGAAPELAQPLRVKVSQVGPRLIARPLAQLGDMLNFVVPGGWNRDGGTSKRNQIKNLHESVSIYSMIGKRSSNKS